MSAREVRCETVMLMAVSPSGKEVDARAEAIVAVTDALKPEAAAVVGRLKAMGVAVSMLTGDNRVTAIAIAKQCGIPPEDVVAQVLPAGKLDRIKSLQDAGLIVAMVRVIPTRVSAVPRCPILLSATP
jgi:cation transport ATPase